MTLEGDLDGLTLSDALRQRIPPRGPAGVQGPGLSGGVVDLDRVRASYDAKAPAGRRLHYDVQARLRDGIWNCPKLPFTVNDLSAAFDVEDGLLTLHRAEGYNGMTTLRPGEDAAGRPPPRADGAARRAERLRARPAAAPRPGRRPSTTSSGTSSSPAG